VEITAPAGGESLAMLQSASASGIRREPDARLSSTNVPVWLAGIIAAVITTALYLAIFIPLQNTYIGQLFGNRGPMQHCTTLVTLWGLAILVMKYVAVKKQQSYAELELELIPLETGLQITPSNVEQFLDHLAGLQPAVQMSILGRRIRGALEHFKSRNSVPEVQQFLATQAELDASNVDSGYSLLRSFIWVIPLLGFIGTVTGISDAVSGLDAALKKGAGSQPAAVATADPAGNTPPAPANKTSESLLEGLGLVTHGLAVAFDTTFLALVMAIVLLFPTEALRKIEYGMLDRIEAFTNESLLRRMADDHGAASAEDLPEVVQRALEGAFHEHERWLAQWQVQVGQLGQMIGADFEAAVNRIQDQVSAADKSRLQNYESLARIVDSVFEKASRITSVWQDSEQGALAKSKELLAAIDRLQQVAAENAKLCNDITQQQSRLGQLYADGTFLAHVAELGQHIGRLADKLDATAHTDGSQFALRPGMAVAEPNAAQNGGQSELMVLPPEPARGKGLFGWLRGRG
jgi:biopolymer transport protein ExbB/TolQ